MKEKVSLVPRIITENHPISFAQFNSEDLEFYAVEALKKCYYFSGAPEFYEIWDNFHDEIITSGRIEFFHDGISVWRHEINETTLEYVLDKMKIEYIDFQGHTFNDAQNILLKELL